MASDPLPVLAPNDFASNQEVRWCPGCGDFSVLTQVRKVLADTGVRRENVVFVSGNGCSSRLPYYLSTYGFHGIHGRAPAIATGLKLANPNLQTWVITGDGDGLAIGAGQLLHLLRRNVDVKVLLFNNEIFGLTKGQKSPTSRPGTPTVSSPLGSREPPVHAISFALGCEATFVARTIDVDIDHLGETLARAVAHKGSAFVEIYQNCKIFNDGVFSPVTDPLLKNDNAIFLEHGRPILFGKDRNKGIRVIGFEPEVVTLGAGIAVDDLLMHDERTENPSHAFLLSRFEGPEFPECFGVFRSLQRPTYEEIVESRRRPATTGATPPQQVLQQLLVGDDSWVVP